MHITDLRLCLVTHPESRSLDSYEQIIRQAISGGVTSIQLRNKTEQSSILRKIAIDLLAIVRPLHIPLIINDNVALAKEIDADGVHLGQSDMPPVEAREILGPDKIIGWSIETYEQLERANQLDCIDYIAASAIFPSKTKLDCKMIWGLAGLKTITQQSRHPVVAIGGININNVRDVMMQGAVGAAVISAIHDHAQPKIAAFELFREINQGIHHVRTH